MRYETPALVSHQLISIRIYNKCFASMDVIVDKIKLFQRLLSRQDIFVPSVRVCSMLCCLLSGNSFQYSEYAGMFLTSRYFPDPALNKWPTFTSFCVIWPHIFNDQYAGVHVFFYCTCILLCYCRFLLAETFSANGAFIASFSMLNGPHAIPSLFQHDD